MTHKKIAMEHEKKLPSLRTTIRNGIWWNGLNSTARSCPTIEHTPPAPLARGLKRGDEWVFGSEKPYELQGDVGNVAFPCGYTLGPDGDTLHLYYGAADTSIALATGSIRAMLAWLDQHG